MKSKTLNRLKDKVAYFEEQFQKHKVILEMIQQNPQMEEAIDRLLGVLETQGYI